MMLVKEELVEYLTKGYIHVSRQDYLFFNNLIKIAEEKRVTTGQDKLLNKLIDKYKRQLVKERLDVNHLKNLRWNHDLLESKPEYQRAELSLVDNELILRSPYHKGFSQSLSKLGSNNTFVWDKINRLHRSPATTFALKNILGIIAKHFSDHIVCENIQKILDDVRQYENCHWSPTLVYSNGNYYIAACNEVLNNQLQDVTLNNHSATMFKLNQLGINVTDNIANTDELKFASTFEVDVDINNLDNLCDWIRNLGISEICMSQHMLYNRGLYKEIREKFLSENITVLNQNELKQLKQTTKKNQIMLLQFRSKYDIGDDTSYASKIVLLKNSRPIDIR
jgi:hypothetical protein